MVSSLRVVLFFLYTGQITFAPPGLVAKGTYKWGNAGDFSATAKSVYLAADKVLRAPSPLLG